ncbi:PREDICTED: islet amyloid polypeptide [Ceratotherium simum simum]|uniref:Islet amyloid polypeptide n=1 Tax=Ceratotherium simum simum TaxID=73337 RepID=A0ABM1D4W4_CERSS|nr:PREDICTED: islet amyloid polypeptide [Ceratotherium simum simum]
MCILKLPVVLIVLSVALNHPKATPIERQEWIVPVLSRNMLLELRGTKPELEAGKAKSHQVEKRKCNTATCSTQCLKNFLVHSSNNLGAILSPTNVGSNMYGKRNTVEILNREPLNYLPL